MSQDAQAELSAEQSGFPSEEFRGAGGGGGGSAIGERPPPPVPDLGHADPTHGLATIASLPPAQLLAALGGVAASASRLAAQEHANLASHPPQRARHPGAPATVSAPAASRHPAPAQAAPRAIPRPPEGRDARLHEPEPLPTMPAPATAAVPQPQISAGADGQLTSTDTQQLTAALAGLPARDPALGLSVGAAPQLPLEGNADPKQVHEQRGHLNQGLQHESAEGRQQASAPMGEEEIFPTVPDEALNAEVAPAGTAGVATAAAPPPAGGPDGGDENASILAGQLRGGEIRSAVSQGVATVTTRRQEYAQRTVQERARSDQEMASLEAANTAEQGSERAAAKQQVHGLREQWTGEQQALVDRAEGDADETTRGAIQTVATERLKAQAEATARYQAGEADARAAQRQAEQQAAAERQKAQSQTSGGLLGWVASAAQSFFDRAKQAVQAVFDAARSIVRAAIERAQQLATAVLEAARQTIVAAIRTAATALMAIGDRVLSVFPALRERFRSAIQDVVARAEAAVNRLAQALKDGVHRALNALGTVLTAVIGLYERGMQLAISGVRAIAQGAISFAQSAISALGVFAVLIRDIAAGPIRWVSNLAAGAADGIRNFLWPALLTGIKGWFNEKVQSIVGLGTGVWSLLKRGGITLAQVGTFVWEGIKAAIPQMVIWVLIEKLVSLIVPAAAAVMLIIQALQAAWSSIGKIMQAISAFINFLKGVRWGNAGPLFGVAIVASAIAVIDFISNFLLQKLMGAVGKVAGKLRNLAKRIGTRLAGAVRRGVAAGRAVVGRVVKAGGAAAGAVARGAAVASRYVIASGRAAATTVATAGKAAAKGVVALGGTIRRRISQAANFVRTGVGRLRGKVLGREPPMAGAAPRKTRIVRLDDDFAALENSRGTLKAHLESDGSLVPANPAGNCSALEHVYGFEPAKGNSPYSSFLTEGGGGLPKSYGKTELELDLPKLQADIAAGRLPAVEVLPPGDLRAMIIGEIESTAKAAGVKLDVRVALANGPEGIEAYVSGLQGLSRGNAGRLSRRLLALFNTSRDGEYLVKGVVPPAYLRGPVPKLGGA